MDCVALTIFRGLEAIPTVVRKEKRSTSLYWSYKHSNLYTDCGCVGIIKHYQFLFTDLFDCRFYTIGGILVTYNKGNYQFYQS